MSDKLTEGGIAAQLGWALAAEHDDGYNTTVPLPYFEQLSEEWRDLTKKCDALRELLRGVAAAVHMAEDHEDVTKWAVWKRVMAELKDTGGIDDFVGIADRQVIAGQPERKQSETDGEGDMGARRYEWKGSDGD